MLNKYSNTRNLNDNIKLACLTAFSAGMVNIVSLLVFLAFSSNITGYYAIITSEIIKGNFFQAAVVLGWIFLFFFGSFTSNFIIIHLHNKNKYFAHSFPVIIEIVCLITVSVYGQFYYKETLNETEILLALLVFAMGIQNGLTASISNFLIKTTHLTGATTDLGILLSMFTKKEYRRNKDLMGRAKLLISIFISYISGAIVSGFLYTYIKFKVFYLVIAVLLVVIMFDFYKLHILKYIHVKNRSIQKSKKRIKIPQTHIPELSIIKQRNEQETSIY